MTKELQEQVALRIEQIKARVKLDQQAREAAAAGITIQGITLAAGEADQQAFARLLTLLREAEDLLPDSKERTAFLATAQVITDIRGTPHTLPDVRSLRELLVAYGASIRQHWTIHATARAAIRTAATREELAARRNVD